MKQVKTNQNSSNLTPKLAQSIIHQESNNNTVNSLSVSFMNSSSEQPSLIKNQDKIQNTAFDNSKLLQTNIPQQTQQDSRVETSSKEDISQLAVATTKVFLQSQPRNEHRMSMPGIQLHSAIQSIDQTSDKTVINQEDSKGQIDGEDSLDIKRKEFNYMKTLLQIAPHLRSNTQIQKMIKFFSAIQFIKQFGESKGQSTLYQLVRNIIGQPFFQDQIIFNYGELGSKFYIVVKGRVGVLIPTQVQQCMTASQVVELIRSKKNLLHQQPALVKADKRRGKLIWIKGEPVEGRLLITKNKTKRNTSGHNSIQGRSAQRTPYSRAGSSSLLKRKSVVTGLQILSQQSFSRKTPDASPSRGSQTPPVANKKGLSVQLINMKKKFSSFNVNSMKVQRSLSKVGSPSVNLHSDQMSINQEIQVDGFDPKEPDQRQLINYSIMQQVAILQPGKSFGELALMTQKPRVATIVAKQDGYFAIVQKIAFKRILQRYIEKQMKENIDFLHQHLFFKQLGGFSMRKLFYYFKQKVYNMQTHVYKQTTRDVRNNKGHVPLLTFKKDFLPSLNNSILQMQQDQTIARKFFSSASPTARRTGQGTTSVSSQMGGDQGNFTQFANRARSQAPDQSNTNNKTDQAEKEKQRKENLIYFIKQGEFEMSKQVHLTSAINQLSDQHQYVKLAYMKLNSSFNRYCRLKDFYEQLRPDFKGFEKRLRQQEAERQMISIYNQQQMYKKSNKISSCTNSKRTNIRIYQIIQQQCKMKQFLQGKTNHLSPASIAAQDKQQKHLRQLFQECEKFIPELKQHSQSSLDKLFSVLHKQIIAIESDDDYLRKTYYRYISRIKQALLKEYEVARQRQIQTRGRALETPEFNPLKSDIYDLPMQELLKLPELQIKPNFASQKSVKRGLQVKQLVKYKKQEKMLKVSVMGPGQIFGIQDSLFRHCGRLTTVTCKSKKGVLLTISIQQLLKRLPRQELRKNIFKLCQMKLQFIQDRIRSSVNLVAEQHHKYDIERRQRANQEDSSLGLLGSTLEKKYQRLNMTQMSSEAINILANTSTIDNNQQLATFDPRQQKYLKQASAPFMMDIGGKKVIRQWKSRNVKIQQQSMRKQDNLMESPPSKTFDRETYRLLRDDSFPKNIEFPSIYMTQDQIQARNDKNLKTQQNVQAKLDVLRESIQNKQKKVIERQQQISNEVSNKTLSGINSKFPQIIKSNKILFKNPDIANVLRGDSNNVIENQKHQEVKQEPKFKVIDQMVQWPKYSQKKPENLENSANLLRGRVKISMKHKPKLRPTPGQLFESYNTFTTRPLSNSYVSRMKMNDPNEQLNNCLSSRNLYEAAKQQILRKTQIPKLSFNKLSNATFSSSRNKQQKSTTCRVPLTVESYTASKFEQNLLQNRLSELRENIQILQSNCARQISQDCTPASSIFPAMKSKKYSQKCLHKSVGGDGFDLTGWSDRSHSQAALYPKTHHERVKVTLSNAKLRGKQINYQMNKPAGKASIHKAIRKIYFNNGADVMKSIYQNREEFSQQRFVEDAGQKRMQKNVKKLKMKSHQIIQNSLMGYKHTGLI